MNRFLAAQETDQIVSEMQLAKIKNTIIKHMYFTTVSNS